MDATAVMERQADSRFAPRMLLVLGLAVILFFARLSERALWSEEVRWAQIPREMQRSGNYFWPTINGRTYYDKPLGSYWLVLLAALITDGMDETSARLPSALSGLAAVAFAMLIARRLYDDATALWTGVILATSFSFVFFARAASTDVETVAGVLAACWIFLRNEANPPGPWTLLLWFVMALTSLTKGLLGFVLPMLIIGLYSTLVADSTRPLTRLGSLVARNRWFFNRWTLAAVPLGVLVYLGPFLLSLAAGGGMDGLAMVYRENIRRFFDPVNHRGPIYLYAYIIFMLQAPWSLLLPAALVHAHTSSDKTNRARVFALAYFWGTFVFFTLSSSRRSYYLLPILPAVAMLIAQMFTARESLGKAAHWLLVGGFAVVGLAAVLSGVALLPIAPWLPEPLDQLPPLPVPAAFAAMWLFATAGVMYALVNLQPWRVARSVGVISFSVMAYLYLFALPATEVYRTQKPFAEAVQQTVDGETDRLGLFGGTREIVFYLNVRGPIREFHTLSDLENAADPPRWIIVRRRDWEKQHLSGNVVVAETLFPWEDAATAAGKLLLVEIHSR